MANENNEISDIVKKCKILLLDIEGTTTSISFVKDKLFPYAAENVKEFLETKWEEDDVKEVVAALRKLALEDQEKSLEGVVTIPGQDASKEEQIEGLVNNVKWQMMSDRKAGPLKQLQGLIWKQGYDKGDIKGHVYDDVLPALEQWRSVEGHKIYIYSSGSVQAQKLLFGLSSAGDLLPHIDGHFDTAVGAKQEEASYKAIAEKIDCKTDEILFLTDIVEEAAAGRSAGVHTALVSREGNAPLSAEATASYPVLHSFEQLAATNKRKPDTQDEQPAKVPKTEADGDVKSIIEESVEKVPEVAEKLAEPEPEKMEVDDTTVEVKESKPDAAVETSADMDTVVEDVVDKIKVIDEMQISDNVVGDKTEPNSKVKKTEAQAETDAQAEVKKTEAQAEVKKTEAQAEVTKTEAQAEVKKTEAQAEVAEKVETETINKAANTEVDTKVVDTATAKAEDAGKSEAGIIVPEKSEVDEGIKVDENEIINKNEIGDKNEVDVPVVEIKVVDEVVEKPEEKEVENMDAEPIVEEVEKTAEDVVNNVNDKIDVKNNEETVPVTEKTPTIITEIEEITDDKQILNEVAEIIEDIEPVIEEPTITQDIEDLKNVGDVLEKECDEILSKVQDVTNLDSIPIKPLLNPIVEETMDTENTDSNDIVDRILDTEMELGMKQCEDVPVTMTPCEDIPVTMTSSEDFPVNTEVTEIKADTDEKSKQAEPDAVVIDEKPTEKVTVENKEETKEMDTDCTTETADDKSNENEVVKSETVVESRACSDENKSEIENSKTTSEETKMETESTDESKPNTTESKTDEKCEVEDRAEAEKSVEVPESVNKELPVESSTEKDVVEEKELSIEEVKADSEATDAKINGNTNGESATVNLNGDASSEEALSSRLQVENGKEPVNGSNGDSVEEQGQGDNKVETVSDIKVKIVASDETRSDPIEQPTEA